MRLAGLLHGARLGQMLGEGLRERCRRLAFEVLVQELDQTNCVLVQCERAKPAGSD